MIHCLLSTVAYFANPKNIIDCKHPIIEAQRELFGKRMQIDVLWT